MTKRVKTILLIVLLASQILVNRYIHSWRLNIDLFFLILVYFSIRSSYLKSIIVGTIIGLITDHFSGYTVMGVYGFSRTITAYLIFELAKYLDLKRNTFVFFLIFTSLCISNLIANIFFYFTSGVNININMILYQPFLTAIIGLLLISSKKVKTLLNVY